jgi:integrase
VPRKRPDGRFEARLTLGWTPDGKQVRKSVYGATRAECSEKLKKALANTTQGAIVLTQQGRLSLAEFLTAFHAGRHTEVGEGTQLKEKSYVRLMEKRVAGGVPLADLKPAHLETLYRDLALTHAPSTIRHLRSFINKALRQAVRHEVLATHVGLIAELPRMKRESVARAVAPEELVRIVQQARETRYHVLVATIAVLGVRHGEALGFQWGDVDWETGAVQVVRTVVDRNRVAVVSAPKTRASRRTLYLPAPLLALWQRQRASLEADTLPTGPTAWVFPSRYGNPMIQRTVRDAWKKILTAAEVETPYRIHDLRHTFISRLIESGADPKTAADLAGHTDPRMTLGLYTHTRDEHRKKALMTASASLGTLLDDIQPASGPTAAQTS